MTKDFLGLAGQAALGWELEALVLWGPIDPRERLVKRALRAAM